MYHPFFNINKLTDDQLIDKLNALYMRLGHAESHGQHQMVNEIRILIDQLTNEQHDRMYASQQEKFRKDKIDPNEPIILGEISKPPEEDTENNNDNL